MKLAKRIYSQRGRIAAFEGVCAVSVFREADAEISACADSHGHLLRRERHGARRFANIYGKTGLDRLAHRNRDRGFADLLCAYQALVVNCRDLRILRSVAESRRRAFRREADKLRGSQIICIIYIQVQILRRAVNTGGVKRSRSGRHQHRCSRHLHRRSGILVLFHTCILFRRGGQHNLQLIQRKNTIVGFILCIILCFIRVLFGSLRHLRGNHIVAYNRVQG